MASEQKTKFKQTEMGAIPVDWSIKTLEEVAEIVDCLHSIKPKKIEKGIVYLEVFNLIKESASINFSNLEYISDEDYKFWTKRTVPEEGDLVITNTGIAATAAIPKNFKCCIGRNMTLVKPNRIKILPEYLRYYSLSKLFDREIQRLSLAGTVLESMHVKYIGKIKIAIPNLEEQRKIINILTPIFRKIELNQQMNKNLEAMGLAIFKHWFIDFEFPNNEGKPYKSSGGVMVYSGEFGKEIPKGRIVKKLNDFIDLQKGLSYKGKYLCDHGTPMVNLGNMASYFGFIYDGLKFYNGEYKNRHLVKPGDIVIANTDITQKRDVLGSPAIVPPDLGADEILFTHHIYAVRNKSKLSNLFIYFLLQQKECKDRARGYATGTTVLALPKDAFLKFKFAVPADQLLEKFCKIITISIGKINQNNIQNKTLNGLRDILLPKLMSGQIRVKIPETEATT